MTPQEATNNLQSASHDAIETINLQYNALVERTAERDAARQQLADANATIAQQAARIKELEQGSVVVGDGYAPEGPLPAQWNGTLLLKPRGQYKANGSCTLLDGEAVRGDDSVVDFGTAGGFSFFRGKGRIEGLEIRNSVLPVTANPGTEVEVVNVSCVGLPDPGAKQSCFSFTSQAKAVTFDRVRFVAPNGGWAVRSYSPTTIIRGCTFITLAPTNCLIRLHAPESGADLNLTLENNRVVCVPPGYPLWQASESIDDWCERLIAYAEASPLVGATLDVLTLSNGDGSGHPTGAGKFRGVIRNNTLIGGVRFDAGVGMVEFVGNECIRRNDPIITIVGDGAGLSIHDNLLRDPGSAQWGAVAHAIKGGQPAAKCYGNWYINPQGRQAIQVPGVTLVAAAPAGQQFGANQQ